MTAADTQSADFDLLFHGFYSIKVEAIYTLSILGQQVLDVHGRRVHDLPRILLRYGQRAGELSQKMLPIQSWRLSLSRLMMAARHP